MLKKHRALFHVLDVISDIVLVLVAFYGAQFIRFALMDGHNSFAPTDPRLFAIALVYSIAISFAYYACHFYTNRRYRRLTNDSLTISAINGVGTLVLVTLLFLLRLVDFSRIVLVLFWALSSAFSILKRLMMRLVIGFYRKRGFILKHVVIVGNGHLAWQCMQDFRAHPEMGVVVDGYVSASEKPELGKCLGSYEDLGVILETRQFDTLIVALEPHEVQFMRSVLEAADKEGTRVELIPFYNDYLPAHPTIKSFGHTRLINLRATPLDSPLWAAAKRLMDVLGALAMIVLFSPIMLVVAVGVKLSSPGPIFFRQERMGKDKKSFYMLKFRSMRQDTDPTGWTTDDDPRKTKFGAFIRKYSLDELPQAFNVLLGHMSLVGPRPELPRFVRQFKEEVPLYLVRQQVRPGITGWAQVHGLRGDTSIEARVEYDIWYIQNWSLSLDIKILFKTVFGGGMINNEVLPSQSNQEPAERS